MGCDNEVAAIFHQHDPVAIRPLGVCLHRVDSGERPHFRE